MNTIRSLIPVLIVIAVACGGPSADRDAAPAIGADQITANNRGVGLMGQFDFEGARQVFAELAAADPELLDVRVNLAIATLNRQKEVDDAAALEVLDTVLAEETPDANIPTAVLSSLPILGTAGI